MNEGHPPATALDFEQAMQQLEHIVNQLEQGSIPLEKSIDLFQEGMKLSVACQQKLKQAEQRIEMLLEQDGQWVKKPFAPADA
jgi:exodeoxyribonuclease VII small subunit